MLWVSCIQSILMLSIWLTLLLLCFEFPAFITFSKIISTISQNGSPFVLWICFMMTACNYNIFAPFPGPNFFFFLFSFSFRERYVSERYISKRYVSDLFYFWLIHLAFTINFLLFPLTTLTFLPFSVNFIFFSINDINVPSFYLFINC